MLGSAPDFRGATTFYEAVYQLLDPPYRGSIAKPQTLAPRPAHPWRAWELRGPTGWIPPRALGPLQAHVEGFDLRARLAVAADRSGGATSRLEKLVRYCARPARSDERLSLHPDGRVVLKTPWADGTTLLRTNQPAHAAQILAE